MKALALTQIGKLEVVDMPEPQIENANDVLIKIEMVGICGSDVHYFETGKIGSQVVEFPYLVGHECGGTVIKAGASVTKVKEGDRIAVDPAISCFNCSQCNAGRPHTCKNLKFLGCPGQIDGCLSEYIVMPQESCFVIPDSMTFEQAVLTEPFAIGYYAVKQSKLQADQDIAILGAGPIGLSCLTAAATFNPGRIFITEKIAERIEIAKKAGANWVGNPDSSDIVAEILQQSPDGVDVVFECAGQQETIDQALEILKPGGTLMLIGIPRLDTISIGVDRARRKEISIINVRRQNECTKAAVDLISLGKVNVDYMATHHYDLKQAQEGFETVANYRDGVIKAFIDFKS